jgi:hypothetical protein
MSLKIQNSRLLLKRSTISGATPTVFTGSTDYTDGTWGVNDIYGGELFLNMQDKKLWFGYDISGGTGVELIYPQGSTSGSCLTDLYVSNLYGCSPINLWDNITVQTGVTINSADGLCNINMDFTGIGEISLNYNDGNTNSILTCGNGITTYVEDIGSGDYCWLQQGTQGIDITFPTSTSLILDGRPGDSTDSFQLVAEGVIKMTGGINAPNPSYLFIQDGNINLDSINISMPNIPSYDDDADAAASGLTSGSIYQTTGGGASPLDVPGILMIKQP